VLRCQAPEVVEQKTESVNITTKKEEVSAFGEDSSWFNEGGGDQDLELMLQMRDMSLTQDSVQKPQDSFKQQKKESINNSTLIVPFNSNRLSFNRTMFCTVLH
jgi:hypothetical protein